MLPNQATNAEVIREPPRPTHTGGPDCAGRRVFEWSGAGRPAGHGARVALRVGHRQDRPTLECDCIDGSIAVRLSRGERSACAGERYLSAHGDRRISSQHNMITKAEDFHR
jgi:hypothetical protein